MYYCDDVGGLDGGFKCLTKPGWSDSTRRIVEYLVALFVFIGVHIEGPVGRAAKNFISSMIRASHQSYRDNIAATIAATLGELGVCEVKSNLVTLVTVKDFCDLTRACLQDAHPMITRMVMGQSYTLSVALALFHTSVGPRPRDDTETDALILKRKRVL